MQDPMPGDALIEPSWADAMSAISASADLSRSTRIHWACSMRVVAEMMGRPAALIAARMTAVRGPMARLHHSERHGMSHKTLANHDSNVRAALRWFARKESVPLRGVRLSPAWESLKRSISPLRTRATLFSLMRYCSANDISPLDVEESTLDAFMAYRAETTALSANAAARRKIVRAWNSCLDTIAGWPPRRLAEPPLRRTLKGPEWDRFPEQLRREVEDYLSLFQKMRKSPSGRRWQPCKTSTINMRRARLIAFARKAIALGVPLESLNTLQALLRPDLVERVLEAYCADSGEVPSVYTIDLAAMLEGIAKQWVPRDEESIARLADMRAELEQYRAAGLTAKNAELVRKVLTPRVWSRVVELPNRLLLQARACRDAAPVKAAVLAQMACAICLLTVAPVRLANLASARLETNLVRPDGAEGPFWLVYPEHDVKNRVRLEFPLDQQTSDLIEEYVKQHQPILMRGRNELYLWPGEVSGHKGKATLSAQITKCIQKATGLRVTVHQFRHAAAALILQAEPGNYEFVRRILGHKNIKTTIDFYTGLETAQATRIFGQIVRGQIENRAQNLWERPQ